MEQGSYGTNIRQQKRQQKARKRHIKKTVLLFVCIVAILLSTAAYWGNIEHNDNFSNLLTPIVRTDSQTKLLTDVSEKSADNSDETAWSLILVNRWNLIPDDYEVELTQLSNGKSVDTRIYPALQEMFDDARADGIYPVVASGYRTAEQQQSLLDKKIAEYEANGYSSSEAKKEAEMWVAIPGTSEHQLGIAVDINADGVHSPGYKVYDWLNRNGYKYGFILRYPPEKSDITSVTHEPWHYRYVGIKAATEMHESGLCLEEYLS